MKPWILVLLWLLVSIPRLEAQSNSPPLRLALVATEPSVAAAADLLTVELSKKERLQLLERTEIAKVYREQGLSVANQNYLKLGQVLGADGLLVLDLIKEGTNQFLQAQLVAVKPGVVIGDTRAAWPMKDISGWAGLLAKHFDPLYPKLGVQAKDALPISVVNLRAAVRSSEEQETEQQFTSLLIARLTHEPRLFVLERRRMESLGAEKELKGVEESAFWNGSYLVDGVIDRDGYSRDTVTINARLVPPKGGAPVPIELSGSRTNVADLINQLAEKVMAGLNVGSLGVSWNPAEEAEQYFEEANWALRWEMYPEAHAAADSAWSLGKRDMDCAMIRVRAHTIPFVPIQGAWAEGVSYRQSVFDGIESHRDSTIKYINQLAATHAGMLFALQDGSIYNQPSDSMPDAAKTDAALDALNLYWSFSQTLAPDEPRAGSPWYLLGIEELDTTAQYLQQFYLIPKSRPAYSEKLAELRALARSVAEWMEKSPSVRDIYFSFHSPNFDAHRAVHDLPNIFHCEASWGCFWQETPEDCVALYRRLLGSTNFVFFNEEFGSSKALSYSRGLNRPRLIAWNDKDHRRIESVWSNFVQELNSSTNEFLRMEGSCFKDLYPAGLNTAEILVKYADYWRDMKSGKLIAIEMAKEKQYFQEDQKFELGELTHATLYREYSKEQAEEILPLLSAYRTRLADEIPKRPSWMLGQYTLREVDDFVEQVTRIAKPGLLPDNTREAINSFPTYKPAIGAETTRSAAESPTAGLLIRTFYPIPVEKIPSDDRFFEQKDRYNVEIMGIRWIEEKLALEFKYYCQMHVNGGGGEIDKLAGAVFDPATARWEAFAYPPSTSVGGYPRWPYDPVPFGLYKSDYYYSEGAQLKKRMTKNGQWEVLNVPGLNNSHLYSLQGHLFAANMENILEVTEGGKGARVLASIRRRPAVTTLDSLDSLSIWTWSDGFGSFLNILPPILFRGPENATGVINSNSVLTWQANNWHEIFKTQSTRPPEVFPDGIIFRSRDNLWLWDFNQAVPDLCLYERQPPRRPPAPERSLRGVLIQPSEPPAPKTLWNSVTNEPLLYASVTYFNSNLYFLADHATVTNRDPQITEAEKKHETTVGRLELGRRSWTIVDRDGCHAHLICLSRDCPEPIVVPLTFDLERGQPPLTSLGLKVVDGHPMRGDPASTWLHFSGDNLYMGEAHTLGLWSIPVSEVNAAVARQKKLLQAKMASAAPGGKK